MSFQKRFTLSCLVLVAFRICYIELSLVSPLNEKIIKLKADIFHLEMQIRLNPRRKCTRPDTLKKKKTKRNNKDLDIVKKHYG